jgi:predicted helicase
MTARHPASRSFLISGLFDGLSSFAEVEARISSLPNNKERGNAFEVFAEAYLATQKINEAHEVWPFESIPLEQRKLLALDTGTDMGVDGTYQTHDGELRAYQVKFRSNRPALTWDELSTFMGLTDQVRQRVLFTNCETLPKLMRDRSGFIAIRGSDLDRLTQEDFEAMRVWLQSGALRILRKQPLPHQKEALETIASELNITDRATIVMACGTGKSLVALWAAENRGCRNILVLLPSLALVRQLLHEWLRQTSWESLTFQCVCSDSTVAKDADDLIVHQADLDFPVTTESSAVRHFLTKSFDGAKVVFSTYQSAHVVAEGMPLDVDGEKIPFDLGVFDEAHKTAGREGRNYGFALTDAHLPIRKRMFLTATPRHYNSHKRDKEGEAQVVYSMDNPDVYGKQAYVITFGEAARRGIICNYKVLISVITSEMVTDELLSRGEVLINGDAVRARQVANQIALRDAVEKYGVKKIFTFHKTVKSAASFVSDGNEGIRTHLVEFKSYHVNGEMPTARRDKVMHEFREANKAVMSNARCLTEGVDVPAVDMVAFLSPRRSRVDIVQATGRAMRRADGKNIGYVLVPLYVEVAAGESVETAVSRAEFDEVWDVLQSLQEQDEVLAEFIRYVGEQKGRGKGFDDRGYADRIDFVGACLSLEKLRAAVATRCVENLHSSWDSWFGKLQAYKEQFGHCNVVTGENEYRDLASWVSSQRVRKAKGTVSEERIERLSAIGFVWDFQQQKTDETWMKWYRELKKYTLENGNPHVPRTHSNTKLASWVWIQRIRRVRDYSSAKQLRSVVKSGYERVHAASLFS